MSCSSLTSLGTLGICDVYFATILTDEKSQAIVLDVVCLTVSSSPSSRETVVAPSLRKARPRSEICYSLDRVWIATHKRCNIMHQCHILLQHDTNDPGVK